MIIAGLTGGIGHGKTTFASLLADETKSAQHFETWELVAEVATALRMANPAHPDPDNLDAINQWLTALVDCVDFCMHVQMSYGELKLTTERLAEYPENYQKLFEYLRAVQSDNQLASVDITSDNKELFRPLLQWLGGYLVATAGSGVWYDEILRRVAYLQNRGYELVTVGGVRYPADAERLRNASGMIVEIQRPGNPERDSTDITERERNLIKPDTIIINDGTLEQLRACGTVVYQDLRLRQLKPRYQATSFS